MGYGNRIISNTVTSAPKSLPISVEDMKTYMNQPFSEDDTLIENMITAARQYVESKCNISIGQQEHKVVMATDGDARFLPSQPLISLDEVNWTNCDCMAFETASESTYATLGETFVQFRGDAGYWELTYTAGYKPVPAELLNVIKAIVVSMYEQRGDSSWSVPAWIKEQMKQYTRKSWV
jgi:hypothetical protein